jgi:hypothetical protein
MKAVHALAAALALTSGLAFAQTSQNADQNTSTNGAPAPQRMEQQADTGPATGSRNLGDPATMNNNGDYLEACKQLGVEARKDCIAQAKRDRMQIDSSSTTIK